MRRVPRLLRLPSSRGIGPEKLLLERSSFVSTAMLDNRHNARGTGPRSMLSNRLNFCSWLSSAISGGIIPERLLF
uniref:Uncharacterized protein n=1 Tax=Oryza meridionalis TaxID=40149 RepID=A0A0E0EVZ3_9ORYZ